MIIEVLKKVLLLCAIFSCSIHSARAQKTASEYEVKAAFLFNFIKFVEWPAKAFAEKDTPYIIGVLGNDPFFDPESAVNYLDQAITNKAINNRKLELRKSARAGVSGLKDLKDCHLIFISKSEKGRMREILAGLEGGQVLSVSETDDFCAQGGVVNFVLKAGKVRFEINQGAAEAAGLKISSKLLNVATLIPTQTR